MSRPAVFCSVLLWTLIAGGRASAQAPPQLPTWQVDGVAGPPLPSSQTIACDPAETTTFRIKNNGPDAVVISTPGAPGETLRPGMSVDVDVDAGEFLDVEIAGGPSGGGTAGGTFRIIAPSIAVDDVRLPRRQCRDAPAPTDRLAESRRVRARHVRGRPMT